MAKNQQNKPGIDDFKDRFSSPFVGVRIDPKTRKPVGKKSGGKKSVKKK